MIDTTKTAHGDVSVRTTSLGMIELRTYVHSAPNHITALHLTASQAEALQNALGRMRGMLPCPRYREALDAVAG